MMYKVSNWIMNHWLKVDWWNENDKQNKKVIFSIHFLIRNVHNICLIYLMSGRSHGGGSRRIHISGLNVVVLLMRQDVSNHRHCCCHSSSNSATELWVKMSRCCCCCCYYYSARELTRYALHCGNRRCRGQRPLAAVTSRGSRGIKPLGTLELVWTTTIS